MRQLIYIIATRSGVTKLTKRVPYLDRGEIGVALRITIPDEVFKNPLITADLDITETHVIQPTVTIEPIEAPHGEDAQAARPPEAPNGQAGEGEVPAQSEVRPDGLNPQQETGQP